MQNLILTTRRLWAATWIAFLLTVAGSIGCSAPVTADPDGNSKAATAKVTSGPATSTPATGQSPEKESPKKDTPAKDAPKKEDPEKKPTKKAAAGGVAGADEGPQDALQDDEPPIDKEAPDDTADQPPFSHREKAPSLDGGVEWINTAGPIDLADLRGKFVLLDFWTYCCINCMHVLPELKKLEKAYPNEIVVIGVHSAKFDAEKDSENIKAAVLRYEIEHPVVNDAEHHIWDKYSIRAWPEMRLIDPQGYVIAGDSGEIPFEAFDAFLKKYMPYYEKKGLLDRTPLAFALERAKQKPTPLRFPGKILAHEDSGRLYISDSGHNRIVVTDLDGKLIDVIGDGQMGTRDGDFKTARFDHPQGMVLRGDTLYVADTENHMLRKVDLKQKQVATIAGTGKQNRGLWPGMDRIETDDGFIRKLPDRWVTKPKGFPLASPWALAIHGEHLYLAMAGPHQIWRMKLDESEIEVYAGNGREDIIDGRLAPEAPPRFDRLGFGSEYAAFAQPSGLASDGETLFVADSEGSSIRAVPFDAKKKVKTVVGSSELPGGRLFLFGDRDGTGLLKTKATAFFFRGEADQTEGPLLQHALGIVHHNGLLFVADTYNNKIKVIDPKTQKVQSLAGTGKQGRGDEPAQFDEPGGISYAAGKLFVADTNNHTVRIIDLKNKRRVSTLAIAGLNPPPPAKPGKNPAAKFPAAPQVKLDRAVVKPQGGAVGLNVKLNLPEGWKINKLAPMAYTIDAKDPKGPISRAVLGKRVKLAPDERNSEFTISLPTTAAAGEERLAISLTYYYCSKAANGVCKVGNVVWQLPLVVSQSEGKPAVSILYDVPPRAVD